VTTQELRFRLDPRGEELAFQPRHALIVGYAGRDQELSEDIDDAAIFCGSVPLLEGAFTTEPDFVAELRDPRCGATLRGAYLVLLASPAGDQQRGAYAEAGA
jgi:hypothetical protein